MRAPSCSNNEITASHPDVPATSPCQIYGATPASIAVWDASTQTPAATPAELRADFTARCYACAVYAVSVTSRCSTKTDKHRLTQTTSHDSSGTLVFWCQTSPRNSTAISTLWTWKISPQQVVDIQVISTTRPWSVLFMTPVGQWKRLDRVMVDGTCLVHIASLQLQPSNFITSICSGLVVQVVSGLLRGNRQDFN